MLAAADEPDVTIPEGATIDTDAFTISTASGTVAVKSVVVANGSASTKIVAFIARSFVINSATVYGKNPVAFVAPGKIQFQGSFDLRARAGQAGAGAADSGNPCNGQSVASGTRAVGGGAGNGTLGGAGKYRIGTAQSPTGDVMVVVGPAGQQAVAFSPLVGGCRGGGDVGGAGGGAMQVDSLDSITINGLVDMGAQGGAFVDDGTNYRLGGGGSGGVLVLEAPHVAINGGIVANGGAGAACSTAGPDGLANASIAVAPSCGGGINAVSYGGSGGNASTAPTDGGASGSPAQSGLGAGGGAVGRLRVSTTDGTYTKNASATMSVAETLLTLTLE